MNSRLITHIAITLSILLYCIVFTTAPQANDSGQSRRIVISVPKAGWPPYIVNEGTENKGIMIDVIREIANTAGVSISIKYFPEMRSQLMLQEGYVDAIPKAKEWVEDPSIFHWTDPIVSSSDVMVFRAKDKALKDKPLTGMNIGVILGYSYPTFDSLFSQGVVRRHNATSTENLLNMLQHGHVEAAVTNQHVAEWLIKKSITLKTSNFSFGKTVGSAPYRFAFTRTWASDIFIARFNSELAAMKKDGRFQAIMDKYQ